MTLILQNPTSEVSQSSLTFHIGNEVSEPRFLHEINQILEGVKKEFENLRKPSTPQNHRVLLASPLMPSLNSLPTEEKTEKESKSLKNDLISGKTVIKTVQSKTYSLNGITSSVLRYPHLIEYLSALKENLREDLSVLILGPGVESRRSSDGFLRSPQTHEILAAFSRKVKVTIVDIAEFVNRLTTSIFSEDQKEIAKNILSFCEGYNIGLLTPDQKSEVRKYMENIPQQIQQDLKLVQHDFADFDSEEKYDYIFALLSLRFALRKVQDSQEASLSLIEKYFSYLKDGGCFLVDESLYLLMRRNIIVMPSPEELIDGPLKWSYLKTSFEAKRIFVSNTSRDVVKIPVVLYKSEEGTNQWTTTSDIYCIKKLSSKRSAVKLSSSSSAPEINNSEKKHCS